MNGLQGCIPMVVEALGGHLGGYDIGIGLGAQKYPTPSPPGMLFCWVARSSPVEMPLVCT